MTTTLADGTIVQRINEGLLTAVVDGELIGMSIELGTCYGLNAVATRIWELLAEPQTIPALCEQLTGEYEIDPQSCRRDVAVLIEKLHGAGLLTVREP